VISGTILENRSADRAKQMRVIHATSGVTKNGIRRSTQYPTEKIPMAPRWRGVLSLEYFSLLFIFAAYALVVRRSILRVCAGGTGGRAACGENQYHNCNGCCQYGFFHILQLSRSF